MNIIKDERNRIEWTINWIERMTSKYGATVWEQEGDRWDWGQALCRECYGKGWNDLHLETPTWDDIHRAQSWEKNIIPDWVDQNKTQRLDS